MVNLRDLRMRMRAISQTLQVTSAMNLISTSKLRKGRRVLEDTEPYFIRIHKSMYDLLSSAGNVESEFFRKPLAGRNARSAVIVITSDKGLAGGYNANVIRHAKELCETVQNPALILIGNIGHRYFAHTSYEIFEHFSYHSQLPVVDDAGDVANYITSQFLKGTFDEIYLVYTHMYSSIKHIPLVNQILPLDPVKIQTELSKMGDVKRVDLKFEFIPSKEEVFDALVPQYIKGIVYGCMVEAYASEQSARMAAMDEATKSAEDMLAGLQLVYNRARQAGITQEMSEIVGGAVAL